MDFRKEDDTRPNVVFLLTDQMRGDCLSISGHPTVETPNLDMMASRGVNFTASYSSCPSCIAARASMFTGLRPRTHGRRGYQDGIPWTYENTLAQLFSDNGYQTHCVGKTHFYPQRNHLGFHAIDSYEGDQQLDPWYVSDYKDWLDKSTNGRITQNDHGVGWNSWYARPSHLPEELHNNTWVATKGIDFLRRRDQTRPFFLNLSFHRPHPPIDPPQVYFDMYRDRELEAVPIGDWAQIHDRPVTNMNDWHGHLPQKTLDTCRRAYFAQIAHIDNQIGRFLMEFKHFTTRPTWFIFTSDHGEMLGDHHMFRKSYAYEGSAKTPMIICPPYVTKHHQCDAPIAQEDLMPTMLAMAGIDIPDSVEGLNMLPLLEQTPEDAGWREFMHGEHSSCYSPENGMQFITDGKTKYIWFTVTGKEQLFDLTTDPQELRDLASDPAFGARLEACRKRMIDILAEKPDDGLSDGTRLIPGTKILSTAPELRNW